MVILPKILVSEYVYTPQDTELYGFPPKIQGEESGYFA